MRTARFACVMLVFLLSALDLCRSNVSPPPQSKTVVQYQPGPIPGFPVISVRLNDKVTARLVIDTGSANCYITDKVADKLGLTPTLVVDANGHPVPFPGNTTATMIRVARFQVGSLPFPVKNVPLVLAKSDAVPYAELADGILGLQVLQLFAVLLDPVRNEVTLWYPGNLSPEDRRQVDIQDAASSGIVGPDPHSMLYTTAVHVADEQMDLVVDTGNGYTTIPTALAKRLALKPEGTAESLTMWGKIAYNAAHVPRLSIGNLSVSDPVVFYSDKEIPAMPFVLGLDTLNRYRLLLDFPAKSMFLKEAIPRLGIGIHADWASDGRLVIVQVVGHSPAAEAGLQVGDEIAEINGQLTQPMGDEEYIALMTKLTKREGNEITLKVKRKGEDKPREVRLTVRKLR